VGDVVVVKLATHAANQRAHAASVDEQGLAASVLRLGTVEEPQARGYLRVVEQLRREGNHAVHQVSLNNGAADRPFAAGVSGHGAIRQHKPGASVQGEVVDDVLHPGEVGVACGWDAITPAHIIGQQIAAPVAHVEGRIGQNGVGFEIAVQVVVE